MLKSQMSYDSLDHDDDDVSEKILLEMERDKHNEKLRSIDHAYKAYQDNIAIIAKRQKETLEELLQEQERQDIALAANYHYQAWARDHNHYQVAYDLVNRRDRILPNIEEAEKKIKAVNKEIFDIENEIIDKFNKSKGREFLISIPKRKKKKLMTLERQLIYMEQCYGKQLAFNNELRAEINNCRTKRDQFRMIDTRLRDELAKCRKEIMCACDRATDAFQLRDEIEAKIALMKNKQAKDVQQQEADIKELYRIINHERKTRSFVNTKNDDRSAFRKEETDRRLTTVTHKSTTNSIYTALQVYEDAFDDFTIAMKAKNMVDAMQRFSGQEAELFSLCKYISRLTNESDQLEKEKELLRLNCDKCAKEEVHMFSQQKIIAKELEARLVQCETARKVTDERATYANKALDQLRVSAQRWFGILCDPVEEGILDSNADDRSLMVHLGRVEQVMLEMLQVLEFKQRKDTHMMMGAIHVREFGHQRPYEKYKALQLKIAPPDIESDHTMTSNETNLLHAIMSDDLRGDSAVASPHQQPQRAYGGAPRQPNHEGNGRRTRVSNSPRRQRQHNDQRNSGKN